PSACITRQCRSLPVRWSGTILQNAFGKSPLSSFPMAACTSSLEAETPLWAYLLLIWPDITKLWTKIAESLQLRAILPPGFYGRGRPPLIGEQQLPVFGDGPKVVGNQFFQFIRMVTDLIEEGPDIVAVGLCLFIAQVHRIGPLAGIGHGIGQFFDLRYMFPQFFQQVQLSFGHLIVC